MLNSLSQKKYTDYEEWREISYYEYLREHGPGASLEAVWRPPRSERQHTAPLGRETGHGPTGRDARALRSRCAEPAPER